LIITDREDLDNQIHKNFVRTEVIGQKEECQPKNSKQLREYLQSNKAFIFTLIHKFRYDKGKKYPVLSTRDDIIVMVDWYKDDQPKARVKSTVERSLNADLPDSYDAESFRSKIDLLMNHFVDMAVQGYGWIGSVA
jgi:hypothetical protein